MSDFIDAETQALLMEAFEAGYKAGHEDEFLQYYNVNDRYFEWESRPRTTRPEPIEDEAEVVGLHGETISIRRRDDGMWEHIFNRFAGTWEEWNQ